MNILKSSNKRLWLPALGALTLIGLTGVAVAKPGADGKGADRRHGGMCAKLSCTDQQEQELRAIKAEVRSDSKGDREAIKRLHGQLAAEFAKDTPDEDAMRQVQQQIESHQRDLHDRGFDAMMEVHALLDSDQRAKLAKVMERRGMRGLMGGRKGRHHHRGGDKGKDKAAR